MARAKNISRSDARRRARLDSRSEREAAGDAALIDGAGSATDPAAADAAEARPERRAMGFKLPNFRQDLRDLPQILTSRRAMILAPLMLVIGFTVQLAGASGVLSEDYGLPIPLMGWVSFAALGDLYVQTFFLPPALLTFFLAGYIAPRASYLVGALLGVLSGAMWLVLLLAAPQAANTPVPPEGGDVLAVAGYVFLLNVGYGAFAAAFAAWDRDFLRRMRDQGTARRAEREANERAKRRDSRQEERRTLKRR